MNTRKQLFRPSMAAFVAGSMTAGMMAHGQGVNNFNPGVSFIYPSTTQIEQGPVLDVVPYVLSDGYTINLTLIPSVVTFQGYQDPATSGPPIPANITQGLNAIQGPVVLPEFSIQQVVTTVNVWDNQTVVIGGLISSQVNSEKDAVPVLGDIPLVGRLFQSQSKKDVKNNLMIFVTATIVDPAGNRVHSDDELPFAQTGIPEQQSVEGQKFIPGNPGANSAPIHP